MVKRQLSLSTQWRKKSEEYKELQELRKRKMDEYLRSVNYSVNLLKWSENTPCPICGTITAELKDIEIREHFNLRKKRGERHAWVCWICCQRISDPPINYFRQIKSKKPRGWRFMSVFVDSDGTVFYKGIEQPDLKGTLPPTVIDKKDRKKKLSNIEKEKLRNDALVIINSLMNKLKQGVDDNGKKLSKKEIRLIEMKIKEQEKFISKLK